jgi:hypothetical protein
MLRTRLAEVTETSARANDGLLMKGESQLYWPWVFSRLNQSSSDEPVQDAEPLVLIFFAQWKSVCEELD